MAPPEGSYEAQPEVVFVAESGTSACHTQLIHCRVVELAKLIENSKISKEDVKDIKLPKESLEEFYCIQDI